MDSSRHPARGEYMTVDDLALELQVHEDTVRAMLARGELPGIRIGRRWFVRRRALDALFAKAERGVDLGRFLP